jgi:uncharacterized membrane-anchored protein
MVTCVVAALATSGMAHADRAPHKPAKTKPAKAEPAAEPAADVAPAEAPAADGTDGKPEAPLPKMKAGPQVVDLGNGVEIDLPQGMLLLEQAEARAEIEKRGDDPEGTIGIVFQPSGNWELDIGIAPLGHVSDGDAGKLDAGDLLKSFRDGTTSQNATRRAKGSPELSVVGWSKPPGYDRAHRVLTWAVDLKAGDQPLLNDFTNVLGRRGFVQLNLIAPTDNIAAARVAAASAIAGVRFRAGSRYEDYDASVDHDSGLGLRELIVGGSVVALGSKLGLFAKIFLALKKLFILVAIAIGGFFKKVFGRGKKSVSISEPPGPSEPPVPPPAT